MPVQRDYYADLELPRDADINDIKKQFRRLALKYHPDRNPGREQEVNAQFQIIQAANEVLSNPSEKAKYDANLGQSSSRYPGASGVRGNPWANAGAQFPTPPRRSAAPRNAQSGAQRWQSRFAPGVPPTAKQTFGAAEAEARKNAAKAFESMRKNAPKEPQPAKPPRSSPPPPPPRQNTRTESAKQRAEASFGSRKPGYHPRSTMPGDEPAVSNQHYSHTDRREVPPPPPQRPSQEPLTDPLSQFRDKVNPNHINLENGQESDWRASATISSDAKMSSEGPHAHSSPTNADIRTNIGSTPHDHSKPGATESSSASTHGPESSKTGYSMYDYPRQHKMSRSAEPLVAGCRRPKPDVEQSARSTGLESSSLGRRDQSPSGRDRGSVTVASFEKQQTRILIELIDNRLGASLRPRNKAQDVSIIDCLSNATERIQLANKDAASSFTFPLDDDTFKEQKPTSRGSAFGKSSVESIHTSFANDDGPGAWQFNANPGEADANVGYRHSPGDSRRGRSCFVRSFIRSHDDANHSSDASQAGIGNAFNAEGWSDKFSAQTFVPQQSSGPSSSPTRNTSRASSKKTKVRPTAGTAAAVEYSSSEEESYDWGGRNTQRQPHSDATHSPQAMDIDSPDLDPSRVDSPSQTVRNIPVEPSRPEWRAGQVDGLPAEGLPERPAKIPLDANAAGSEDSEEFQASFADLRNVAPLSRQNDGLNSLDGLKDNLPFESQASNVSIGEPPEARPLKFPTVPAAPRLPPAMAIDGLKPNVASWARYLTEFEDYLRRWDAFNDEIADHFSSRKTQQHALRAEKGYGFLGARADGEIQEYLGWIQQDNDVRRRWLDASEEHQIRMREFMAFREKMRA